MKDGPRQLVEDNLDLSRRIAHRIAGTLPDFVDRDEMLSDAAMGLMEAAAAYQPERGVAFRAFASRRIRGAVMDGLRTRSGSRRRDRAAVLSFDSPLRDPKTGAEIQVTEALVDTSQNPTRRLEDRDEAEYMIRRLGIGGIADPFRPVRKAVQKELAAELGICQSAVSNRLRNVRVAAAAYGRAYGGRPSTNDQ